jgi:uncharacterized protein
MEIFWIYLPLLVPVVVANLSERHRLSPYSIKNPRTAAGLDLWLRTLLPYGLPVSINLGLLAFAALALLSQLATMLMPEQVAPQGLAPNWWAVAAACLATSLLAFLPLIPAVRRWLARFLPIDPGSVVHMTAMIFAVYQIGLSLGQMALIGDLENLTNAELALTVPDLLLTAVPLILFAVAGVGLFIRRGGRSALERLGLLRPTWKQLILAVVVLVLFVALNFFVNSAWQRMDPASFDLLDRVTNNLFGNLMTTGGAIALGLSAGISEELLFRGAVQPRLGLLLATILFAIGHLQYGLTVATLQIFVIGLVLGLVRKRTHTTICILIHAGYNAAIVLLGLS